MEKKYWKGVEELNNDPEFTRLKNNEFFENLPLDEVLGNKATSSNATPRRDFLKFLGFGIAAASLAACEPPIKKAIPYLIKPEEITPGVPNYYASTYADGNDYCSILVKTREGRPIKIEGNELSSVNKGGVNARVQASVLSLYDNNRLSGPMAGKKAITWKDADTAITLKLGELAQQNKRITIVSPTLLSPSTKKVIVDFTAKYPTTKHVVYDAVSYSGIVKANELSFGKAVVPAYHFEKAEIIVSFGADFLANWISPVEHAKQYGITRKLRGKKTMSRHIQFESNLSLTGSNADYRYPVKPGMTGACLVSLYNKVASLAGSSVLTNVNTSLDAALNKVAKELWEKKGKALVVSGSNDVNEQMLVNGINLLLAGYDSIIDLDNFANLKQSNDSAVSEFIRETSSGETGAVIFYNTNPAYSFPDSKSFASALARVSLKISFSDRLDETALLCDYTCPDHHFLESWNDAEPYKGKFSLCQPTIQPLFKTRQAQESLLTWAGAPVKEYLVYLQDYWKNNIYALQTGITSSDAFWNKSLENGVFELPDAPKSAVIFSGNLGQAASAITSLKPSAGIDLVLYEKTGIGNGNQANNPWLQELPDPISKICWDNYFTVSPAFAQTQGYKKGDVIEAKLSNGVSIKAPVYPQPGQANETIGLALGYGRTAAGKAGDLVGTNAYPAVSFVNGVMQYYATGVTLNKTVEDNHMLAATQTHHTMMGREIVKETTLEKFLEDPKSGNEDVLIVTPKGKQKAKDVDLWATEKNPGFDKPNHRWGLAIDLNSCIGCGACVVSCQAENNVPVVGKDEINRSREMHWIRIDRYYSSEMTKESAKEKGVGTIDMYRDMEVPSSENPGVVFQPVMCQHCNHAPCETVCPVVATTHSEEGLNMMAYNRCVGTRYCANNCPYKVRRFNWFKYSDNEQFDFNMNNDLGKMVLNPDVVVRSRGVMEKCTMCIQRIQHGKLESKKSGKRPVDGEIKTACSQSCPTNAIIFGDFNDPSSEVAEMVKEERSYYLLEELNVQPSVFYQTKVRNKSGKEA